MIDTGMSLVRYRWYHMTTQVGQVGIGSMYTCMYIYICLYIYVYIFFMYGVYGMWGLHWTQCPVWRCSSSGARDDGNLGADVTEITEITEIKKMIYKTMIDIFSTLFDGRVHVPIPFLTLLLQCVVVDYSKVLVRKKNSLFPLLLYNRLLLFGSSVVFFCFVCFALFCCVLYPPPLLCAVGMFYYPLLPSTAVPHTIVIITRQRST